MKSVGRSIEEKKPLIGVSLIEPHIDRDKVRSPCVEHFVCQYISIYLS